MVHTNTYMKLKGKLHPVAKCHVSFSTRTMKVDANGITFQISNLSYLSIGLSLSLNLFFSYLTFHYYTANLWLDCLSTLFGAAITICASFTLYQKSWGFIQFRNDGNIHVNERKLSRTDITQIEVLKVIHANKYHNLCYSYELRIKTNSVGTILIKEGANNTLIVDQAIKLSKFTRRPAVVDLQM